MLLPDQGRNERRSIAVRDVLNIIEAVGDGTGARHKRLGSVEDGVIAFELNLTMGTSCAPEKMSGVKCIGWFINSGRSLPERPFPREFRICCLSMIIVFIVG
jgi:hypothetical protein